MNREQSRRMHRKHKKVFTHQPENLDYLERLHDLGLIKGFAWRPEILAYRVRLNSGTILEIPEEAFAEWFLNIIDQERGALIAAHAQNDTPDGRRIKEIQAELDIYRGVVPTPVGYEADPLRVRDLVAELKTLLEKTAQA